MAIAKTLLDRRHDRLREMITSLAVIEEEAKAIKEEMEEVMDGMEEHFSTTERFAALTELVDDLTGGCDLIEDAVAAFESVEFV